MQARFVMPTPPGVSQDDGWYSFDQGSVHVVAVRHRGVNTDIVHGVNTDLGVNTD
jgi:hypothetical protein